MVARLDRGGCKSDDLIKFSDWLIGRYGRGGKFVTHWDLGAAGNLLVADLFPYGDGARGNDDIIGCV
jgi:hypothetical protein